MRPREKGSNGVNNVVLGGIVRLEVKGQKGGVRGTEYHIVLSREKASLGIQSANRCPLMGNLNVSQTLEVCP
jgi:hypothetical protein